VSTASRLEALIAQHPGLDAAGLAAELGRRGHPPPAADVLADLFAALVAGGRVQVVDGRYRLAGPATDTAEHQGRAGPDPVRYGDWERKGICVDF
jgi:predicted methyltransferase